MKKLISKIDIYPILLFIIIGLFTIPTLIKKDFGGDFLANTIPHYSFILTTLKTGEIPYWFPYSYLGLPEIFKSELAIAHPITITIFIIDFLFNQKNSLNFLGNIIEVSWVLYLAIGGLGFYKLAKSALKMEPLAAFIGALVFCLNPLMLPTMNTIVFLGMSTLPWIFYSLYQLINESKLKYFVYLIFFNYLVFAAGYPYFYVYFFLAEIALVLILNYKKTFLFLLSLFLSTVLAAFFLFPGVYIYFQSFRDTGIDLETQLWTSNIPTRIVNILNPMPYGSSYSELDTAGAFTSNGVSWGIFSLVYLILGFLTFKKNKFSIWLFGTFVISLFYSFGGYLGANQFFGTIIPFVDKFRSHSISLSLTMFTGCIFISQGVVSAINGERKKILEYSLWIGTILAITGLFLIPIINPGFVKTNLKQVLSVSRFIFIMGTSLGILYLTLKNKTKDFLYIGVVILLLEFYFYFINLNGHFTDLIYSKQYEKNSLIPSDNSGKLFRTYFDNNQFAYNTGMHKVFSYGGYEASTYKGWYLVQGQYGFIKSLQLSNVKYFVNTNPRWEESNPSVKLIKDTGPDEKPSETFVSSVDGLPFNSKNSKNKHYTYEILGTLERFFVPKKVEFCQENNCDKKDNLPETAYVKDKFNNITNPDSQDVKIENIDYRSSSIKLSVTTTKETFIVASETWDSGWELKINGKDSKLFKVSNNFRGFIVPEGTSEVLMTYTPPFFIYGIFTTLFGFIILAFSIIKFNYLKNIFK